MGNEQSITEILEEVKNEMCSYYCKWPENWDEEAEGVELSESTFCRNCPLNKL